VRYSEENRRDPPELTAKVLEALHAHDWPGNVRELENCIERAVVLSEGRPLTPGLLAPPSKRPRAAGGGTRGRDLHGLIEQLVRLGVQTLPEGTLHRGIVRGVERELIEQVLKIHKDVQVKAAKQLGINRNTLFKKVGEFNKPEDGQAPSGDGAE